MKRLVTIFVLVAAGMAPAWAVDGVTLINQSAVVAAGGCYTITQPGSYKLSGNIVLPEITPFASGGGSKDFCGIYVNSPGVTLDLAGFTIQCPDITGNNIDFAIVTNPDAGGFSLRNGTILADRPLNSITLAAAPRNLTLDNVTIIPHGNGSGISFGSPYRVNQVFAPSVTFSPPISGDGRNPVCPGIMTQSVFFSISSLGSAGPVFPCVIAQNSVSQ